MKFLKKMISIFNKIYPEITISYPKDFKEFFIYGSMEDLEEVVGNLIENGCKFGKKKN